MQSKLRGASTNPNAYNLFLMTAERNQGHMYCPMPSEFRKNCSSAFSVKSYYVEDTDILQTQLQRSQCSLQLDVELLVDRWKGTDSRMTNCSALPILLLPVFFQLLQMIVVEIV